MLFRLYDIPYHRIFKTYIYWKYPYESTLFFLWNHPNRAWNKEFFTKTLSGSLRRPNILTHKIQNFDLRLDLWEYGNKSQKSKAWVLWRTTWFTWLLRKFPNKAMFCDIQLIIWEGIFQIYCCSWFQSYQQLRPCFSSYRSQVGGSVPHFHEIILCINI